MALIPGTRLGPYEVSGPLGAGGMGEVYRATDTNLKRPVAIKVLPESVAGDASRLARFQREAEVLAALNHPNIAAIYGLERSGRTTALVMELVEGPTLADRIARGPIPVAESLGIARQIAEALEAAHEQGIVHRDLKPANIKVRPDDTVKVLDFGLAKAAAGPGSDGGLQNAANPTMTSPAMTEMGMILGTAAYMAPEQAKGRAVDRRADVWAFGAVLYEMVTGARAFAGDHVSEVLASVLAREPDWTKLPTDSPAIAGVVRRCLERDPKQRFGDMQSVRLALGGAFDTASHHAAAPVPAPPARARSAGLAWAVAGAAAIAAGVLGLAYFTRPAPVRDVIRTTIAPPDNAVFDVDLTAGPPVISPDGRQVAFSARSADGRIQLWVRPLDGDARPIAGTEGASFPFWSPDSRSLGFYNSGRARLERVDLGGGAPVLIARAAYVRGAHWGPDNTVLYDTAEAGGQIMEVSIASGAPKTIVTGGGPRSPRMLPGGRHLLYVSREGGQSRVHVASRDGATRAVVTEANSNAIYAHGWLLFLRENILIAQPFDLARLALTGSPEPIARDVHQLLGDVVGVFSASDTGSLLYLDGATGSATSLAWFDGSGKRTATVGEMGAARGVRLSPDDRAAVIGVMDVERRTDLWRIDLTANSRSRLTFAATPGTQSFFSVWTPTGRDIVYGIRPEDTGGAIARRPAAGGPEEILFSLPPDQVRLDIPRVTTMTSDGATIVYSGSSQGGIWTLPLAPGPNGTRTPAPFLKDPESALNAQLSPNQRWLAYQVSLATGSGGVFVEAFPRGGARQQVAARGTLPVWGGDGKTLYFADDNMLTAVDVTEADGTLRFGTPRAVMPIIIGRGYSYDVAKDGRVLALVTSESRAARPLTLIQNWTAALKER